MKNIFFLVVILIGFTTLLSSCAKNVISNGTETIAVNFDAAYVVNSESNSISVINLATNQVSQTLVLPKFQSGTGMGMMGTGGMVNMWPHSIAISPDKSKLVVTLPGSDLSSGSGMMLSSFTSGSMMGNSTLQGKILVLDAVTGATLKEISTDGMAFNAVFSQDGKEIWTALMMTTGKVLVFDASTYALVNAITVGQMPAEVSFSDDGKKVFVANGMSNSVTVIDVASKKVIETTTTGSYPVGAWSGMGGMMYVDNEKDQTISLMNGTTNMMTGTIQLGFVPGMVATNSIMGQMWVSDPNNGQVHIWTTTGTGYTSSGTISVGSGASAMAFSQNGKLCYIANMNDGTVSVVDVSTRKETMKITVGKKPDGLILRYK